MRRPSPGRFGHGLALMGALLFGRSVFAAKTEVKFDSFDKVELHGSFYPSSNEARAPCVMLVHRLGGSRQDEGWDDLAKALQKEGYAVLTFDLRGHGDSKSVEPNVFWRTPANYMNVKGASPKKAEIQFKDFRPDYYPWLANDLAAAKQFLDQQNNGRQCNSANVIVIGAQDGGALGALWIYSEWFRPRTQRNQFGYPVAGAPVGQDISAGVFLSIPASIGRASISNWLRAYVPGATRTTLGEKVPMCFIYGKEDTRAAAAARSLMDASKPARGKQAVSASISKPGKLAGVDLLGKESLKTEQDIINFLNTTLEKKATNPWSQRDLAPLYAIPLSQLGFYNLR